MITPHGNDKGLLISEKTVLGRTSLVGPNNHLSIIIAKLG